MLKFKENITSVIHDFEEKLTNFHLIKVIKTMAKMKILFS